MRAYTRCLLGDKLFPRKSWWSFTKAGNESIITVIVDADLGPFFDEVHSPHILVILAASCRLDLSVYSVHNQYRQFVRSIVDCFSSYFDFLRLSSLRCTLEWSSVILITIWHHDAWSKVGTLDPADDLLQCCNWLGLRRGAFTCVGWQVTLCDPIWQVMSRSSRTSSRRWLYLALTITLTFNCNFRLRLYSVVCLLWELTVILNVIYFILSLLKLCIWQLPRSWYPWLQY